MLNRGTRVVIDTNIWVSAFIREDGAPARVLIAAALQRFQVVASAAMMGELNDVLVRRRIARRIDSGADHMARLMNLLQHSVELVPISGRLRVSRDPNDDKVVETAIAGRADYLISRDEDFTRDLRLINYLHDAGVEVLTVAQFLNLLESDSE